MYLVRTSYYIVQDYLLGILRCIAENKLGKPQHKQHRKHNSTDNTGNNIEHDTACLKSKLKTSTWYYQADETVLKSEPRRAFITLWNIYVRWFNGQNRMIIWMIRPFWCLHCLFVWLWSLDINRRWLLTELNRTARSTLELWILEEVSFLNYF